MKTLIVPASLDSLSAIGQFILEVSAEAGLTKLVGYRLRLAVDEIATNAVVYGGAPETEPGLELRGEMTDDSVTITLEDAGIPFDASLAPPPDDIDLPLEERSIGGLGIHLAITGIDHFSYERVGDRNRNIFVVKRAPHPAGDAAGRSPSP